MSPRKTDGQKIVERLAEELGAVITDRAVLVPTHASRSQRVAGAWVWEIETSGGLPLNIGSQWRCRDLLRVGFEVSDRDRFGQRHVTPVRQP